MLVRISNSDVAVDCFYCNVAMFAPRNEFNRKLKKGTHFFCSRSCACKYGNKRFGVKTEVTEKRNCAKCATEFDVTFFPQRKHFIKQYCSRSCAAGSRSHNEITKQRIRDGLAKWRKENSEQHQLNQQKSIDANEKHHRFSSKAERALAEKLKLLAFSRNRLIKTQKLSFAVDMMSSDKKIWIESDGEFHFRKVHKNHDFEQTKLRDKTEEDEALLRGVLLIRVDNQKFSLDEQLWFIWDTVASWDGMPSVKKMY